LGCTRCRAKLLKRPYLAKFAFELYIQNVYTILTMRRTKIPISIRIDPEVLEYYQRQQSSGYQTYMHRVLEDYVRDKRQEQLRREGRAQELFRQFYATCFWHYRPDLRITSENISLVIEGLRKYGGRKGMEAVEALCQ